MFASRSRPLRPAPRRPQKRRVGPVMLANAEHIQIHLIDQLGLLKQIMQPLRGALRRTVGDPPIQYTWARSMGVAVSTTSPAIAPAMSAR